MTKRRNTRIVLVLGGARSGKSAYAMRLAEKWFKKPLYLATAEAGDKEMANRIRSHKKARGLHWQCVEEPLDIASTIIRPPECDGILLDCMTLWITNVLLKEGEAAFKRRKKQVLKALRNCRHTVLVVSNEVGMGIVPDNELARVFRDVAGRLNQDLAELADNVVFVTAGLPMELKGRVAQ